MDATRQTPAQSAPPAQLAKGALRRLAAAGLEPTPANYARAYADEAGESAGVAPHADAALPARARPMVERLAQRVADDAVPRAALVGALMAGRWDDVARALDSGRQHAAEQAQGLATLIERLARGLERGGRHWTAARKKDSLQRVLAGSRGDAAKLQQRLGQLIGAWDGDQPDGEAEVLGLAEPAASAPAADEARASAPDAWANGARRGAADDGHDRRQAGVVAALATTVSAGLPADEPRAAELADELAALAAGLARDGATPALADAVPECCGRVRRLFGLRHELVDELMALCRSFNDGMGELDDDAGPGAGGPGLRQRLDAAAGARGVRAAHGLLDDYRERQRALRGERAAARDALKQVFQQLLGELGELGHATGRFNAKVSGYAERIARADSLPSLASVVRELVGESRAVHDVVSGARARLSAEHARAAELEAKVRQLELALRQLADEAGTDALTQVANRRGLARVFDAERLRVDREGSVAPPLAVGLLDIDNFKKLNDNLGHAAGDVALQSLALRVKDWLRPVDHLARFGGEEFVVLLPATTLDEASAVLTRLQRQLSASLFMHQGREVFVTFSAGVTAWRPGETMEAALGRADEGLYEAKRSGKNRTCIA